mmetsp:Transcript_22966/g.44761  ORF Transcript_22966/g.44761 Transcript_22966/m.44761 type:complete len:333 (+) Transcript_22966:342-1340(+)
MQQRLPTRQKRVPLTHHHHQQNRQTMERMLRHGGEGDDQQDVALRRRLTSVQQRYRKTLQRVKRQQAGVGVDGMSVPSYPELFWVEHATRSDDIRVAEFKDTALDPKGWHVPHTQRRPIVEPVTRNEAKANPGEAPLLSSVISSLRMQKQQERADFGVDLADFGGSFARSFPHTKGSDQKDALEAAELIRTGKRPSGHRCSLCQKHFRSEATLTKHYRLVHRIERATPEPEPPSQLGVHWADVDQVPEEKQTRPPVDHTSQKDSLKDLLKSARLTSYEEKLKAKASYFDLLSMDEKSLKSLCADIGMKPGHTQRLVRTVQQEQAGMALNRDD